MRTGPTWAADLFTSGIQTLSCICLKVWRAVQDYLRQGSVWSSICRVHRECHCQLLTTSYWKVISWGHLTSLQQESSKNERWIWEGKGAQWVRRCSILHLTVIKIVSTSGLEAIYIYNRDWAKTEQQNICV